MKCITFVLIAPSHGALHIDVKGNGIHDAGVADQLNDAPVIEIGLLLDRQTDAPSSRRSIRLR